MFILTQDLQARVEKSSDDSANIERIDQHHARYLEERRTAIPHILSIFHTPPKARILIEEPSPWSAKTHTWRRGITATVFWIGEQASERNLIANNASAWDSNWETNYGGTDHPGSRNGFAPAGFEPRLNPFYIALPFDDLTFDAPANAHSTEIIPWHWERPQESGSSICKGQWVAIHYRGKVCYAQWEDCGPFHTDDWKYVFGGQAPKANPGGYSGIEVSPAVRDFLAIRSGYRVSWKFAKQEEVPKGPWYQWIIH
ncbi:MAG: hypothetical protein P8P36_11275 [Akkermansiaceae bacterium]|nr:hypothetical protein [Akkermansiaceae bacterium]